MEKHTMNFHFNGMTDNGAYDAWATKLLQAFGKRVGGDLDKVVSEADRYIVSMLNPRCSFNTMDELPYVKYHQDLSSTSFQIGGHISSR